MSRDACKYCDGYVFKTDGNGDHICEARANTGVCGIDSAETIQRLKAYESDAYHSGKSVREIRRADKRKSKGKRKYGYK